VEASGNAELGESRCPEFLVEGRTGSNSQVRCEAADEVGEPRRSSLTEDEECMLDRHAFVKYEWEEGGARGGVVNCPARHSTRVRTDDDAEMLN